MKYYMYVQSGLAFWTLLQKKFIYGCTVMLYMHALPVSAQYI